MRFCKNPFTCALVEGYALTDRSWPASRHFASCRNPVPGNRRKRTRAAIRSPPCSSTESPGSSWKCSPRAPDRDRCTSPASRSSACRSPCPRRSPRFRRHRRFRRPRSRRRRRPAPSRRFRRFRRRHRRRQCPSRRCRRTPSRRRFPSSPTTSTPPPAPRATPTTAFDSLSRFCHTAPRHGET